MYLRGNQLNICAKKLSRVLTCPELTKKRGKLKTYKSFRQVNLIKKILLLNSQFTNMARHHIIGNVINTYFAMNNKIM